MPWPGCSAIAPLASIGVDAPRERWRTAMPSANTTWAALTATDSNVPSGHTLRSTSNKKEPTMAQTLLSPAALAVAADMRRRGMPCNHGDPLPANLPREVEQEIQANLAAFHHAWLTASAWSPAQAPDATPTPLLYVH